MLNKYIDRFQVNGYTISVKLPKSYFKSSNRDYSLLCVQDGDYLFKSIKKDLIFVGIESTDRSNDFTPWQTQIGNEVNGGQADYYLTWLTELIFPGLGLIFILYLWLNLNKFAIVIGVIWFIIGIIYLMITTRCLTKEPVDIAFEELED